jgi:hypothetical protein
VPRRDPTARWSRRISVDHAPSGLSVLSLDATQISWARNAAGVLNAGSPSGPPTLRTYVQGLLLERGFAGVLGLHTAFRSLRGEGLGGITVAQLAEQFPLPRHYLPVESDKNDEKETITHLPKQRARWPTTTLSVRKGPPFGGPFLGVGVGSVRRRRGRRRPP